MDKREQGDRLLSRIPLLLPALIKTAAAAQTRTPLAELAVRASMLLILALFQRANESKRRDFKPDSAFIDIFLFAVSHSSSHTLLSTRTGHYKIIRYNLPDFRSNLFWVSSRDALGKSCCMSSGLAISLFHQIIGGLPRSVDLP